MADWPELSLEETASYAWTGAADPAQGSPAYDAKTAHSGAVMAARDFKAKAAAIDANSDLSGLGRSKAKRKAADEFLARVREHQARLPGFHKARAALLEPVRLAPKSGEDRILDHMRGTELRTHLGGLDPLTRQVALREAAERGDLDTLRAASEAPFYASLADGAFLTELETVALEATAPEKAAALRETDQAIHDAESALAVAIQDISEAAGIPAADPIALAAE